MRNCFTCVHIFCHLCATRFCNGDPKSPGHRVSKMCGFCTTGLLLMFLTSSAGGATWRGITPLHSDKKAVRAKLGAPKLEMSDRMEFERKDGKVVVFFYASEDTARFKLSPVLAGRVLTIYFYPKQAPRRFDRATIAKQIPNVGHGVTIDGERMTSFDDPNQGVSYHFVADNKFVWRIVYYAPRVEFEKFKVSEQIGKNQRGRVTSSSWRFHSARLAPAS